MSWFDDHPGRMFLVSATLPLAMAVILFVLGTIRKLSKTESPAVATAGLAAVITMALAAACSITGTLWLFNDLATMSQMPQAMAHRWSESFDFLRISNNPKTQSPRLAIPLGYTIDRLTALMMCMVTIIGTLIFTFSLGYMSDERKRVHDHAAHVERRGRFARFYFYMLLFAFSMLQLLIADNLLQIFACWELVGTCSFFLIGFYYERKSASTAANKAFIMNRIGDAGFLIALFVGFCEFNSFRFDHRPGLALFGTNWIIFGLGIFAGCVGKSAQFPLQTWLPDAMEGPTPVSALIHAATMVAGGVYLCARCLPLFTPDVMLVVAYTGAITMFISALTACVQTDIKRVLAFSTCSQLGLMFLVLGLGGWSAGLFHLLTHAFFKALLFLAAGSVIYGLHHEQNLLKMGGLRRKMPITAYTMLIGVCAIIGVPLFSGWYSKDTILSEVLDYYKQHGHPVLLILSFFTVVLTAYYMVRLWLLAFAGSSRAGSVSDRHASTVAHASGSSGHEIHESPPVMTVPLLILAAFSIGIAWGWPVWDAHASYLLHILHDAEPFRRIAPPATDHTAGIAAAICMLLGVGIAVYRFNTGTLAKPSHGVIAGILQHRFYFDTLYRWLFTKPVIVISRGFGAFDKNNADRKQDFTLDGLLTSTGTLTGSVGRALAPLQSGSLRGYIAALGLTVVAGLAILWALY